MDKTLETPEQIKSERDYLWKKTKELHDVLSMGGKANAGVFESASKVITGMFSQEVTPVKAWFMALYDYIVWVEKFREQKGE